MKIVQYIACGRMTMIELVSALVAVRIVPENDCSQSRLQECRRTVLGSLAVHIAPGSWLYQKHQVVKIEVLGRHVGDCLFCVDVMSLHSECARQTVLRVFATTLTAI